MAAASPYNTNRWKKTRRAVLYRDGGICMIQGPRCRGVATTVHHIAPSSQAPHLFFDMDNLAASCSACNYGDGARIAHQNQRQTLAHLHEIIRQQDNKIQELLALIAELQQPAPRKRPMPAVY